MTKQKVPVSVEWVGRKSLSLPNTSIYVTISRFPDGSALWLKEAWSVVLEFESSPLVQGNPSKGYARFLVGDAPEERLVSGAEFELLEGEELTAKVRVL